MSIKFKHVSAFDETGKRKLAKNEIVYGEAFTIQHNDSYLEFRLVLCPNGVKCAIEDEEYQSVVVGLESRNEGRKLELSCRGMGQSSASYHKVQKWFSDVKFEEDAIKPEELKTIDILTDPETKLSLALEIEVAEAYFDIAKLLDREIAALRYEKIGFCPDLYGSIIRGDNSTDYAIVCQETNARYPLHKIIARERSPFFENRFKEQKYFHKEKSFKVTWSPSVAEEIRYFLYHDTFYDKYSEVPMEELAEVAAMLGLKKLVAICERSFLDEINDANAWTYLEIAKRLNLKYLKNKALCKISEDQKLAQLLGEKKKVNELRKEVARFAKKRGRAEVQCCLS